MTLAARMGFEALIAKDQPGDGRTDPWLCFQAGYLFAQVEEHRGTVHALAAIKGDLVAGTEVEAGTGPGGSDPRGHGKSAGVHHADSPASTDPLAASVPAAGARQ